MSPRAWRTSRSTGASYAALAGELARLGAARAAAALLGRQAERSILNWSQASNADALLIAAVSVLAHRYLANPDVSARAAGRAAAAMLKTTRALRLLDACCAMRPAHA